MKPLGSEEDTAALPALSVLPEEQGAPWPLLSCTKGKKGQFRGCLAAAPAHPRLQGSLGWDGTGVLACPPAVTVQGILTQTQKVGTLLYSVLLMRYVW